MQFGESTVKSKKSMRGFRHLEWSAASNAPSPAQTLAGLRPGIFPTPQDMELRGTPFALNEDCTLVLPLVPTSNDTSLARCLTEELSDRYDLRLGTQHFEKLPSSGKFLVVGSIQNPLIREFCQRNEQEVTAQNPAGGVRFARPMKMP